MRELLEDIKLSKVSYLVEKLEKRNIKEKIKTFRKLEKIKISKKIGLYLIENSIRNFEVEDEFGGISASLIELCFKNYYEEYNDAIKNIFKDLSNQAQDRVLYLLTTKSTKDTLELYVALVLKYYKERENIPTGELVNKPLSYPYLFPKLYKTLKFDIEKNNIIILLNNYLNSGVVLKDDLKKNKKILTDSICKLFEKALKFKFKNTYTGLNIKEYKDIRYFLELAVNIEYYISSKKTKEYLNKLLKKGDNQLKLFILDNYLRKGENLSKFDFKPIIKDKASRYAMFELLTIYQKTELIDKKIINQKSLAESDLYTNFVIATSYTNEPKNIKFIKTYIKEDYTYYVFKFDYKYKYNNLVNDYLTNYICNQIGIDKLNGEEVKSKFIGISGGYKSADELSIIEKNHKKLLIAKFNENDDIDVEVEKLLSQTNQIELKEENTKTTSKQKNKKEKIKKEKVKKARKSLFKNKDEKRKIKKEKIEKIDKNLFDKEIINEELKNIKKKSSNIFTYILIFLFTVFLCLLIYCMLYIYGVGSINDGIDQEVIKPAKLDDKGNFTEIMGTEIYNQTEDEYFVLLFTGAKKEKTKYYRYINEYNKRKFRFYYVDLTNSENKFLYNTNELDFTLSTDRFLKVKDKDYEYYVDGKTNILNEMQLQIEEIIKQEKEKEKKAFKIEQKERFKTKVISMTDNKKDYKTLRKKLVENIREKHKKTYVIDNRVSMNTRKNILDKNIKVKENETLITIIARNYNEYTKNQAKNKMISSNAKLTYYLVDDNKIDFKHYDIKNININTNKNIITKKNYVNKIKTKSISTSKNIDKKYVYVLEDNNTINYKYEVRKAEAPSKTNIKLIVKKKKSNINTKSIKDKIKDVMAINDNNNVKIMYSLKTTRDLGILNTKNY